MRFTLRLVSLGDPRNRKLITKRLVSDLSVDFAKVEYLISRLPIDILHGATEEECRKTTQDYERLGCRVTKIKEEEHPHEPIQKIETTKSPPNAPHLHISQSPHPPSTGIRLSLIENSTGKPKQKSPLLFQIAGLLLFAIVMVFIIYFAGRNKNSASEAPLSHWDSRPGAAQLQPPPSPQEEAAEESVEKSQDSSLSSDQKVELLEKALKQVPNNETLKQELSSTYQGKAETEGSTEGRIRFYQMAIEFNPYNEAAWDGLIKAYQDAGMTEKAMEAKQIKESRFREAHIKLNKLLSSLPGLRGIPKIEGGVLMLTYDSKQKDRAAAVVEMKKMARKIRGLRNFQHIFITAITQNEFVTEEF